MKNEKEIKNETEISNVNCKIKIKRNKNCKIKNKIL